MKISEPFLNPQSEARPKAFTVSQINRQIRSLLEQQYAAIWVEGEVSNLKKHSSGHFYLTLKDDKAQISAVFFSQHNSRLKFNLKDGMQVLAFGKISLYEARGQYQFYIERLEPQGMGALQLAFIQLKEKLEAEGLFDPARKRRIPAFPRCVGVVTSPTGAAIRDILNVVSRRFCGTTLLLNPVQVQGEGSSAQIARAIEEMNALGGIDVLIVGRGGGSLEDLWAFNEEAVARAVYASKIPVISAVGHEIDWTICDLVADLRAPTPSAAAELVTQSSVELERRVRDYQFRIRNAVTGLIDTRREMLSGLTESYAFKQPLVLVQQCAQKLDDLGRHMQNYMRAYAGQKSQAFHSLAGKLNALSPLGILERGYSISFDEEGKLLKDARRLKPGDVIKSRFWRGIVHSKVVKIEDTEGESR